MVVRAQPRFRQWLGFNLSSAKPNWLPYFKPDYNSPVINWWGYWNLSICIVLDAVGCLHLDNIFTGIPGMPPPPAGSAPNPLQQMTPRPLQGGAQTTTTSPAHTGGTPVQHQQPVQPQTGPGQQRPIVGGGGPSVPAGGGLPTATGVAPASATMDLNKLLEQQRLQQQQVTNIVGSGGIYGQYLTCYTEYPENTEYPEYLYGKHGKLRKTRETRKT